MPLTPAESLARLSKRLILGSVLHFLLVYFLYEEIYGGVPKHFSFSLEFTLSELAISLYCILLVIPVLHRGDTTQKIFGIGLAILPLIIFASGLKAVIHLFRYVG